MEGARPATERGPRALTAAPLVRRRPGHGSLTGLGGRRGAPGTAALQRAVAWLAFAAAWGVAVLPFGPSQWLGRSLGLAAYWVLPGRRRVALDNLARAFGPERPSRELRRVAREHFRHLGATAAECCRLFVGSRERMLARVEVEGREHLETAMARGRGVLYLTAHLGNWELLAAANTLIGFRNSVVVRPLDNPSLEAMLARGRGRSRLGLIPKRDAVRGVLEALGRGECVGILLDQDAGRSGVFVPFFGQAASTSRSLAVLALRTGAPVVPLFIERLPGGRHRVVLEPAMALVATGSLQDDVAVNTARFTAAIERRARAHPEHWFWVHRRWKTRPP